MGEQNRRGGWSRRWARAIKSFVALASVITLGVMDAEPVSARINPYHVVSSTSSGGDPVHILVIVDTSGSMARASDDSGVCPFGTCEDTSSPQVSKIAAAREAIREVVAATDGLAEWGFVGFTRNPAPTKSQEVPNVCASGKRFQWVTSATSEAMGGAAFPTDHLGSGGVWQLCGENRPWPYLRADDLGVAAPGAVTCPIITDAATYAAAGMASRKVQWFDEFKGNSFTATADDASASYGDFNSGTDVDGQTWYYWPCVDGFPGYTDFVGNLGEELGLSAMSPNNPLLELYGPFYIDVDPALLNPNYVGPASVEEARADLVATVQPIIEGGIDVAADEVNWENVIGSIPNAPLSSHSSFSSTTLARYLEFHDGALDEAGQGCTDTAVIFITDGEDGTSGQANYRLAEIARELDVATYMIGFGATLPSSLNDMACAGTGACDAVNNCTTPCDDASPTDFSSCQDPANPDTACAWHAQSADQLAFALAEIVNQILDLDVDPGQGGTVNQSISANDPADDDVNIQTTFRAYTEAPNWKGHVVRDYCTFTDETGTLMEFCEQPSPEFEVDEAQPTFGPCPQSRSWDAGECLQQTAWTDRRIYSHDASNNVFLIAQADGSASADFVTVLQSEGVISGANLQDQADEIAAFVLGRDAPAGWKLPGLANSSPVVVRRIPEPDFARAPEVAIRDPHCGGRYYNLMDQGSLPLSLRNFAEDAWDEDLLLPSPFDHYEYQEAVMIGDDMGVLHAFQLDSGNELWGFLPRFALDKLKAQVDIGAATMGQPTEISEHIFGLAATLNHGWVLDPGADPADESDDEWRHMGLMGMGGGGPEYFALDLSHMSPQSPSGPFEILWTTEDLTLKADYDLYNGETWARPSLIYWVPNEAVQNVPEAYVVLGSGYPVDAAPNQGRVLIRANALTGEIAETAVLPTIDPARVYEDEFGAVVDMAVGSHCLSRFWAEAQETYIADPAGRLFRWDLGRDTAHVADSGGAWGDGGTAQTVDAATPIFPACQSTSDTCTVSATNNGDVFVYPPAVSANDRIDDFEDVAAGTDPVANDEFLIALISGSSYEDTIDGVNTGLDFHSSIYLLVDDHSTDPTTGFSIPADAPKTVGSIGAGAVLTATETGYFRAALTDIERTRRIVPYPGAGEIIETRNFGRRTRPIRSPRIRVVGAVDNTSGEPVVVEGIEVIFIEFTVYEPPEQGCRTGFYDAANDEWHEDLGETFVLSFRMTADAAGGFSFQTGSTDAGVDFGGGFERGLVLDSVDQVSEDGNSGPLSSGAGQPRVPCSNESAMFGEVQSVVAITRSGTIEGFSPVE